MRKLLARAAPTTESRVALLAAIVVATAAGFALGRASAPKVEASAPASPTGGSRPPRTGSPTKPAGRCTLVRVIDGDTIVVRRGETGETEERVRLLRIDAPERGEPGYRESREGLRRLVEGRQVALEFERPGVEERDRYGRLLAYVVAAGVNVNVEMVRLGRACFWTKYGEGRLAEVFRRAEADSKRLDPPLSRGRQKGERR